MEQHANQPDPYAGLDKLNSELQAKKPKAAFRPVPSDLDDLEVSLAEKGLACLERPPVGPEWKLIGSHAV